MKLELFVEQPNIDLKTGIKVTKDTDIVYNTEKVKQTIRNLVLETELEDAGTNGINSYKSTSRIYVYLNDGDILLFSEERGYYMPPYPVVSIDDAITDIESLKGLNFKEE